MNSQQISKKLGLVNGVILFHKGTSELKAPHPSVVSQFESVSWVSPQCTVILPYVIFSMRR